MKKKIPLMIFILAISLSNGYSQILPNTTWRVYDASTTFLAYFHFGTNTLSYSIDNFSYTNTSTFQVNGSNFSIIDLPNAPCIASDTGRYTFLIQNDTLKFITISDLCSSRITALTTYHWIRLQTGIQNINFLPAVKFYPNPFPIQTILQSNKFFNDATLTVYNLFGVQVKLIKNISGQAITISRDNLPNGLYTFHLTENNKTISLVKLLIIE